MGVDLPRMIGRYQGERAVYFAVRAQGSLNRGVRCHGGHQAVGSVRLTGFFCHFIAGTREWPGATRRLWRKMVVASGVGRLVKKFVF